MKKGTLLFLVTAAILVAGVLVDQLYIKKLKAEFLTLEKERIETTNKLATAKIVHENLNHVRDLVFENMEFPDSKDTVDHEARIFDFVTTCINDLKLKLLSVKPLRPHTQELVTTIGYDIEMEGDFFKFGELCSKFENSRRIVSLDSYSVRLSTEDEKSLGGPRNKEITVKMRINTYRVRKNMSPDQQRTQS
ncbi:MAG: type 4a pilus biogenesis protein PilO [Chitinispirillaceae bacterium]|nr:type 4a pilus biogenesis protein PilO [Chitinispirillaceae bacterium]